MKTMTKMYVIMVKMLWSINSLEIRLKTWVVMVSLMGGLVKTCQCIRFHIQYAINDNGAASQAASRGC